MKLVNYCVDDEIEGDCRFCPMGAICEFGNLIGCSDGYVMIRNEVCVKQSKFGDFVIEMADMALQLSSQINGHNLCYGQGTNH